MIGIGPARLRTDPGTTPPEPNSPEPFENRMPMPRPTEPVISYVPGARLENVYASPRIMF